VHNHIMANHTIYSLTPEMKVRFCLSSPFIHPPSPPLPHPPFTPFSTTQKARKNQN
jgi:hypothetical protein